MRGLDISEDLGELREYERRKVAIEQPLSTAII